MIIRFVGGGAGGQRSESVFVLQRCAAIRPGVMVWGVISYSIQFLDNKNAEFEFTTEESFRFGRSTAPQLSSIRYIDGDYIFYLLFFIPIIVAIVVAIIACIMEKGLCKCCCKNIVLTGLSASSSAASGRNPPYERMNSDASTYSYPGRDQSDDNANDSDASTQSIKLPDYHTVVLSDTDQEPLYPEVKSQLSVDAPPPCYNEINNVFD